MNAYDPICFQGEDVERSIESLPIKGEFPKWLQGSLIRNGPGKFKIGKKSMNHWFDGFSLLHKFTFKNGRVSYMSKFLRSNAYKIAQKGRLKFCEFATDPCSSIFMPLFTAFSQKVTDNANVNVIDLFGQKVALTETVLPVIFDPKTLEASKLKCFDDGIKGQLTSAHPQPDLQEKSFYNYVLNFSRNSEYQLYRISADQKKRKIFSRIRTKRPAYMHSFALTENFVVLVEFPFVVDPLKLLFKKRPFIENYAWEPARGSLITVVCKRDGRVQGQYKTHSFFAFHHINSFEENDKLVMDIVAYDDASVIKFFYLDNLYRKKTQNLFSCVGIPKRHILDLKAGSIKVETLSSQPIELPRVNPYKSARIYKFIYAVSADDAPGNFYNKLVKIDIGNKEDVKSWAEDFCFPGEPVFVNAPGGAEEDEGVVLSVVIDTKERNSFLLVLDARTFLEIGRAVVETIIPYGLHGNFFKN